MTADSQNTGDALNAESEAAHKDQELPDGTADFFQYCYPKLEAAVSALDSSWDKFASTTEYEDFYCDFNFNIEVWLTYLTPDDYCHHVTTASSVVSVLNVLCEFYFKNGWFAHCAEVLSTCKPVINRFCALTEQYQTHPGRFRFVALSRIDLFAFRKVAHRYHVLLTTMAATLRRTEGIGQYYRYLILYEMCTKQGRNEHKYTDLFHKLSGCSLTCAAELAKFTDSDLDACVGRLRTRERQLGMHKRKHTVRAACEGCYAAGILNQSMRGLHKLCGRCRAVRYCCKECQVADHARHKALCRAVTTLGK